MTGERERKQLDWQGIANIHAVLQRREKILKELERVGDDFMITDALSRVSEGGLFVLQSIQGNVDGQPVPRDSGSDRAYRRTYWLRVLSDQWGRPVKPGDEVEWKVGQRMRDAMGRKYTRRQINDFIRRGEIRQIEYWHSAIVNEHGCIEVSFEDAALLLDTRGVHYASKQPLTGMKRVAGGPTKTPDGQMLTRHYWLYEEVPPEEVERLRSKKGKGGGGRRARSLDVAEA